MLKTFFHFLFQLSFGGSYEKQCAEKGAEMKSMIGLQCHYGNRKKGVSELVFLEL